MPEKIRDFRYGVCITGLSVSPGDEGPGRCCKLAFLKIVNSEKNFFVGLAPIGPVVRVLVKTERAMDVP